MIINRMNLMNQKKKQTMKVIKNIMRMIKMKMTMIKKKKRILLKGKIRITNKMKMSRKKRKKIFNNNSEEHQEMVMFQILSLKQQIPMI